MDFRKAIEYAEVALKQVQNENNKDNKQLTAKQLGETMIQVYITYDDEQIHKKAAEIINNLELKND